MYKPKSKQRPWKIRQPAAPMENRKRIEFYHTGRWAKYARAYKKSHPLCVRCEAVGIIKPTEVVDHVIPLEICEDSWNPLNHQPLCRKCNNAKAATDKKMIKKHKNK